MTETVPNTRLAPALAHRVDRPDVVVYFVAADSAVKIGHAADLRTRLATMQCNNPVELVVLHVEGFDTKTAAVAYEDDCHARLASAHIRGEWFQRPTVEAFLHDGTLPPPRVPQWEFV